MGNSAVITTAKGVRKGGLGIYVHWNGGRDSIEAFLKYCELKQYRPLSGDDGYGFARLAQVIGNYFGGGTSVGIEYLTPGTNICTDNGTYIVDGWEIVGRIDAPSREQHKYSLNEMLKDIDDSMPASERLGKCFFDSKLVPVDEIEIGDVVLMCDPIDGVYTKHTIIGFGNGVVNGVDRTGCPFVNKYNGIAGDMLYGKNPNNYIMDKMVRKVGR